MRGVLHPYKLLVSGELNLPFIEEEGGGYDEKMKKDEKDEKDGKHSTKSLVAGYAIMKLYVHITAQYHCLSL